MKELFPYAKLSNSLKYEIGYRGSLLEFESTYFDEFEPIEIEDRDSDDVVVLNPLDDYWNVDAHDLKIRKSIEIKRVSPLFGITGIASNYSRIGIAAKWICKDSRLKGVTLVGDFGIDESDFLGQMEIYFPKGVLRKSIDISIYFYLKEYVSEDQNSFFATRVGTEIGEIETSKIILEGNASEFPIEDVSIPDGPLWKMIWNSQEFDDSFTENVILQINKEHKDYKFLSSEDKKNYNPQLIDEMVISYITMLVFKATQGGILEETQDYPLGSIGSIVQYYINAFEIENGMLEHIHEKVGKGVRKK